MRAKVKGYVFAALAAGFYGTNPIFTVPLYGTGMNSVSVLLFRYLLGIPLLGAIMYWRSENLGLEAREIPPLASLGLLMALSSLGLYESYNYMNPGVASTLLFMYPVLTSLIMTVFFKEKFRLVTGICLAGMALGLHLLINTPGGVRINWFGLFLIFISALTYAVYLVMDKVSRSLPEIPIAKSLFYQLLFGGVLFLGIVCIGRNLTVPTKLFEWGNLAALSVFPTVLSLLCTIEAIKYIGPTPTAILGALEPVTAVVLSFFILGEAITLREAAGGALIILSTLPVVVAGKSRK